MEGKYNRKVMIAKKPIHSHNRGPNQYSTIAAKREELKEIEIQKELLRKEVGK